MLSRKRKLALVVVAIITPGALAGCNVCRNGGAITNKGHGFTMKDPSSGATASWTCGWLEESVADVLETGGAPGEAFLCGLARLWAEKECTCSGDPLPPDENDVKDPNPTCNLCDGEYDFDFVPAALAETLVQTNVAGRMPCGGLYNAAAEGVLSANLCSTVQASAGKKCCSAPLLDEAELADFNTGNGGGGEPQCGQVYDNCASTSCCSAYDCKMRRIGEDPICSSRPPAQRSSIAGAGHGGAGGAAKFAN
jgi:hypothetical protein